METRKELKTTTGSLIPIPVSHSTTKKAITMITGWWSTKNGRAASCP